MDGKKWFQPWSYRLGMIPCSWEGWVSLIVWLSCVLWVSMAQRRGEISQSVEVLLLAVLLVSFVALVRAKMDGEARWPWGKWKK
jgi:hypothetical protein